MGNQYDILVGQDDHNVKWDLLETTETVQTLSGTIADKNTVTVAASGVVSAGMPVFMNTDGYVYTALEVPSSAGTQTGFSPHYSNNRYGDGIYDPFTNTVVTSFQNTLSGSGESCFVGILSGGQIINGDAVSLSAPYAYKPDLAIDTANNRVCITVAANTSVTVIGTPISGEFVHGTPVAHGGGTSMSNFYHPTEEKLIIMSGNDYRVGTITATGAPSADTVSFGAWTEFAADGGGNPPVFVYDEANDKVVCLYRTTANYTHIQAGSLSGDTITWGDATVINSVATGWTAAVYDPISEKVIVGYRESANTIGKCRICTVEDYTVTISDEIIFASETYGIDEIVYINSTNKLLFTYVGPAGSYLGYVREARVGSDYNSLILDTPSVVYSASTSHIYGSYGIENDEVYLITFANGGTVNTRIYVPTRTNITQESFLGVVEEGVPNSQTPAILLHSHIDPISDSSPNAFPVVATVDTYAFGHEPLGVSKSFNFNSSGDSITITDDGSFLDIGSGDFQIDSWIYRGSTSGSWNVLFTNGGSGAANNLIIYLDGIHKINVQIDGVLRLTDTTSLVLYEWTVVRIVRRNGLLAIYRNYQLSSSVYDSNNIQTLSDIIVGRGTTGSSLYHALVEFRLKLIADEITDTYDEITEPLPDNPVKVGTLGKSTTQSGLTVPSKYYIETDGSLTTANTGVEVGKSSSNTDLIITR
jgi:hypothetical protein